MCALPGTSLRQTEPSDHRGPSWRQVDLSSAAYARCMEPPNVFTARFDEVAPGGQRRVTVGVEMRDRESDGSIPTAAWFGGEEYRLDIEDQAGLAIYVRRF